MQELKTYTINLKSFDQDIPDFIVGSAGDAYGRTLRVIMTQEALAQLTPYTELYLTWRHQESEICGLNLFKQNKDNPHIFEIKFNPEMCQQGTIVAALKLVDDISITQSQNFTIGMSADPNPGEDFDLTDEYSAFQQFLIGINQINNLIDNLQIQQTELQVLIDEAKTILEELKEEDQIVQHSSFFG